MTALWLAAVPVLAVGDGDKVSPAVEETRSEASPDAERRRSEAPPTADGIRLSIGTGIGATNYRSSACDCFDRTTVGLEAGLYLQLGRFFAAEAQYRLGGMVFPGGAVFPTSGFAVGLRSALTPASEEWWSGFYGRAGYVEVTLEDARQGTASGVYVHPGWAWDVWRERLYVEFEGTVTYLGGNMARLEVGGRVGIRWVVWDRTENTVTHDAEKDAAGQGATARQITRRGDSDGTEKPFLFL